MRALSWLNIQKKIKKIGVTLVMVVLGRAYQVASHLDSVVQDEIAPWKDGHTIRMQVLPKGPAMCVEKKNNQIKYRGQKGPEPDLVISFKNIEAAFPVMMGMMGAETGLAQSRMTVKGDIPLAMGLIRCINRLEAFLFPKFIAGRILKRVPAMGLKENLIRLRLYTTGILLGF